MVRRRDIEGDKEVDLAALVDVLANMLFFLLATVTFLQLKTLNAAVPALSTSDVPSEEKVVSVSVEVRKSGYILKASGELPSGPYEGVDERIARNSDGSLDSKALTKQLWEIKKVANDTKNITILPEQGVAFEDIVLTMDASREMPSILDSKKKVPLFTRPVLSDLTDEAEVEAVEGGDDGAVPEAGGEE